MVITQNTSLTFTENDNNSPIYRNRPSFLFLVVENQILTVISTLRHPPHPVQGTGDE